MVCRVIGRLRWMHEALRRQSRVPRHTACCVLRVAAHRALRRERREPRSSPDRMYTWAVIRLTPIAHSCVLYGTGPAGPYRVLMNETPSPQHLLKVHMANIKTADQVALTITLLAFRT
eukprot:1253024-Prymnesium_polylepis.1